MRGAGYDAVVRRRAGCAALRAAGAACSGKECLPYQLIWGSFARFLEREAGQLERWPRSLPQRRQRLSGVPRQPLPVHRADVAGAPRPRRPRRGRRLQRRHLQRAHDARRLDRPGGRRPAQHAALLPPRHGARARRLRRAVRGVLGAAGGAARASRAPTGARPATWREPSRSAPRSRTCCARRPAATATSPPTGPPPASCATCTCAATSTCAWTSGATTTCSASSPTRGCAPSSSPTAPSSSCCSCARSRTACASSKLPEKELTLRTMRTSSAAC